MNDPRVQTIVLIEDNLDMRMLLEMALEAQGKITQAFSSACDALVFLKEAHMLPALIQIGRAHV